MLLTRLLIHRPPGRTGCVEVSFRKVVALGQPRMIGSLENGGSCTKKVSRENLPSTTRNLFVHAASENWLSNADGKPSSSRLKRSRSLTSYG
jgi:hypothetical protein